MPGTVNCMSDIGETGLLSNSGRSSSGSLVNCDVYWALRASAFGNEERYKMKVCSGNYFSLLVCSGVSVCSSISTNPILSKQKCYARVFSAALANCHGVHL